MASVTFTAIDPDTGEAKLVTAYSYKGKLILKEIDPRTFEPTYSARHLESVIAFSEAAQSSYGERGTVDGLPVTPARVAQKLTGRTYSAPRRDRRALRQEYLKSLVPDDVMDKIEELVEKGVKVRVERPVHPLQEIRPLPRPPERLTLRPLP